jgi:hypothetical protein
MPVIIVPCSCPKAASSYLCEDLGAIADSGNLNARHLAQAGKVLACDLTSTDQRGTKGHFRTAAPEPPV